MRKQLLIAAVLHQIMFQYFDALEPVNAQATTNANKLPHFFPSPQKKHTTSNFLIHHIVHKDWHPALHIQNAIFDIDSYIFHLLNQSFFH